MVQLIEKEFKSVVEGIGRKMGKEREDFGKSVNFERVTPHLELPLYFVPYNSAHLLQILVLNSLSVSGPVDFRLQFSLAVSGSDISWCGRETALAFRYLSAQFWREIHHCKITLYRFQFSFF